MTILSFIADQPSALELHPAVHSSMLGNNGLAAYRANRFIRAAGTAATFAYFSASLFLFANSIQNMQRVFKVLV